MNMRAQQMISLAVVLTLHVAVLFGWSRTHWTTPPTEPSTLFVNLIAPPAVKPAPAAEATVRSPPILKHPSQTRPVPAPAAIVAPGPQPVVAPPVMAALTPTPTLAPVPAVATEAPEPAATRPNVANDAAAPASTSSVITPPVPAAWPPTVTSHTAGFGAGSPATSAAGERTLPTDLTLTCPDRPPATYPMLSRRLNESGTVVLHVEVDERGAIATASVARSSGFARLDAAALATVRTWHCRAPTHNGQPVRATALQPFHFKLED